VRSAVVTFDRHPATVIRPDSAPLLLTDPEQKLELLAESGIDLCVVIPFDPQRANESAEDFVDEILVRGLGARLVVVGEDFHFGHGRKGDTALLRELGGQFGFEVEAAPLAARDGADVSSTRIRALLAAGDVAEAARLLLRPHEVRGVVVTGDKRGAAELGYPTANVDVPDGICIPGVGIYAGWYRRADGSTHPAAISLGLRPTFYATGEAGARPVLEAFLLDFDGDLYGEAAAVRFVAKLRDERRFEEVSELIAQMQRDVAETRRLLGVDPPA
jgi:riboflavin kinase/FMN adenylyltransferase